MIRLGVVPVARHLFSGSRMGLEEKSREALGALGKDLGFELAYMPPSVGDVEEARQRAREAVDQKLDFLMLQHVTFALGDVFTPFLDLPLPLGFWAQPEVRTTGPLPQNSLCGLNFALSLPTKRTQPAKWFHGNPGDEWFRKRLEITVRALEGYKALNNGRLLWIGGAAPGFYRLEEVDVPIEVERVPMDALFEAMEAVHPDEALGLLEGLDEETGFPRDKMLPVLRLELALENMGRDFAGVTLRDWPDLQDRAGIMACAAIARLADRGHTMTCEGDVPGLASMVALAGISGKTCVLMDISHVTEEGVLLWHCGNAAKEWANGNTRLIHHFNRGLPAVRDMRLKPGPVSGLRFVEGKRAMVYAGHVMERSDGFDGVSGWINRLRWAGTPLTPQEFVASVLNLRVPHHFVWGREDHEQALLELCHWMGYSIIAPEPEMMGLRWPSL